MTDVKSLAIALASTEDNLKETKRNHLAGDRLDPQTKAHETQMERIRKEFAILSAKQAKRENASFLARYFSSPTNAEVALGTKIQDGLKTLNDRMSMTTGWRLTEENLTRLAFGDNIPKALAVDDNRILVTSHHLLTLPRQVMWGIPVAHDVMYRSDVRRETMSEDYDPMGGVEMVYDELSFLMWWCAGDRELLRAWESSDDLDEPEHDIKLKLKILARKVVYILDTCASLERRLSKYSLEARSLKRHARTLVIFLTRHYITYPDDVEMTTKQIHKARLLISSVSKVVKTVDTSFSYVSTLPLASSFYIRQFNVLHQNTVKLLHYFEDWEAGRLLPSAVTEENADLRQAQATPYLTIPLDLTGPLVNEILGELATRGESPLDQDLVMGHSIICAAPEITIQRIWSHDNIVAEFRKIGLPHILIQHDLLEGERANIGNGAHGNVRLSKDEDGKIVAVKSIRPSFKATPVVTRIVREAQIWHDLDHRNILKLRGWASTSSPEGMVTALISPFCKHGDLNRYLRDNRNLSRTSELSLLLGISNGLDYVHNKDITHADLRADNILIDEDLQPKLADFGISRASVDRSEPRELTNIRWLAYELVEDGVIQHRANKYTDMYSFGCVCLEVFSRKPPYAELDDSGVKKAKLKHEPPKRPKSLHMDECLWDLTCKFFRFSPATRPTAAAASREIEHIIKWYNNLHTHPH